MYAQSTQKCSDIKILAKIKGKLTNAIKGLDLGKKNSKLSHVCVPLNPRHFRGKTNFSGLLFSFT
jgi:hypothetical protein